MLALGSWAWSWSYSKKLQKLGLLTVLSTGAYSLIFVHVCIVAQQRPRDPAPKESTGRVYPNFQKQRPRKVRKRHRPGTTTSWWDAIGGGGCFYPRVRQSRRLYKSKIYVERELIKYKTGRLPLASTRMEPYTCSLAIHARRLTHLPTGNMYP